MKPSVLLIITVVFSLAFVSRAIGTVEQVRELAETSASAPGYAGDLAALAAAKEATVKDAAASNAHDSGAPAKADRRRSAAKKAEAKKAEVTKAHGETRADAQDHAASDHSAPAQAAVEAPSGGNADMPSDMPSDMDAVSLLAMIKARNEELAAREARLEERERTLLAVEARAREKLAELEAAQADLSNLATRLDAASGEDIQTLAAMYANMKPKQAGAIFNAMSPAFAAGFLTEIRSENAALILASMEPQKAYAVSVIIAGRNAEN